jgi:hypothetical protein
MDSNLSSRAYTQKRVGGHQPNQPRPVKVVCVDELKLVQEQHLKCERIGIGGRLAIDRVEVQVTLHIFIKPVCERASR